MNALKDTQNTSGRLLLSRRFLPMFATQFFGAFNDNILKYAILMVFTYGLVDKSGFHVSVINNLAGLLLILPFFLFSATAGQLADRYERSRLIRGLKIGEIIIMSIASLGFFLGNVWILLLSVFLIGTQAAFFGPIKYAILPDILHEDELMSGNAIFQSATSLAILLGMIIGGLVISIFKDDMKGISITLLSVAVCGYLSSRMILKQRVADPQLKVNWNFLATGWEMIRLAYRLPLIFWILLSNSWYWFYGAVLITQIPLLTVQFLHGNENVSSVILTFFSIGVVIGSALCKKMGGEHVNIRLVPIGAVGLTLFAFYLVWALATLPSSVVTSGHLIGVTEILQQTGQYIHVFAAVVLLGISGGFYIVPLYAMMQAKAPETQRARVVAANNIFNAVFMVCAALFCIFILGILHLDLLYLFAISGMLSAVVTVILIGKVAKQLKVHN